MPKLTLLFLGFGDFILGAWAFIDPVNFVAFVDLAPNGIQAKSEIRAMYGGILMGLGAWQLWSARLEDQRKSTLIGSGFIFGGLGSARLVGLLLGTFSVIQVGFVALELCTSALCVLVGRRTPT